MTPINYFVKNYPELVFVISMFLSYLSAVFLESGHGGTATQFFCFLFSTGFGIFGVVCLACWFIILLED